MPRVRSLLRLSTASLILFSGMSQADEAVQILRGVLGAIATEQMRQQQQQRQQPQTRQPQSQTRQQPQPQAQRQQQPRQPAAPRPSQPKMSLDERMAVQRALAAEGFYQGEVDGDLGPASRRAIADWQAAMGADASGYLRSSQAQTLIRQAPAAPRMAEHPGRPASDGWSAHVAETPPAEWQAPRGAVPVVPAASGELFPENPPSAAVAQSDTDGAAMAGGGAMNPAGDPAARLAEAEAPGPRQAIKQMLFWSMGQLPALPWGDDELVRNFQMMPELRDPSRRQIVTQDPATLRMGLERLAAQGRASEPPAYFVTEIPVQLGNRETDTPYRPDYVPDLAATLGMFGQHSAVTGLDLRGDRDLRNRTDGERASVKLRLERPFYLPLPEDRESWYFQRDQNNPTTAVLRLVVALSDHRVEANGLRSMDEFASATASIETAALILRQQDKKRNILGERELMRWSGGDAIDDAVERPQTAEQIAALYGVAWQEDRVSISPPEGIAALSYVETPVLGLSDRSRGQGGERLLTALKLGAVLASGPERGLDPDYAQQTIAPLLLTSPEFAEIYPLDLLERGDGRRKLDAFERQAALAGGDPQVRGKVMARLPELPLKLRHVARLGLGEYDFARGGFPLSANRMVLPGVGTEYDGQTLPTPDLLTMDVDSARRLSEVMRGVADAHGGGSLFLVADYTLTHISASPGTGPVVAETLGSARTRHNIDAMAFYADPALTMKVRDLPIPEGHSAEDNAAQAELPAEVHATTWASLVATVAAAAADSPTGREMLEQGYFDPPESQGWLGSDREQRLAEARAAMIASAKGSHWLLARMRLSDYDAAAGGFPAQLEELRPASDIGGDSYVHHSVPQLAPAVAEDYALLRIPPDQAPAVSALLPEAGRVSLFLKAPVARADVEPALYFGAPEAAIFGPRADSHARPDFMVMQVALAAPDRTSAIAEDTGAALTAPETLLLDGEGVDLLALSLNPELYDDAAYMRMMIERYSLEALASKPATEGQPARGLPWGRFFKDSTQKLRPDELQAILPSFREWTLARAGMLPDRLLLPVGGRHGIQAHPETACLPMQQMLRRNNSGHFMMTQAAAILGDESAFADDELDLTAPRASIGPDRVWSYNGGPDYATANCAGGGDLPVSGPEAKEMRRGGYVGVLVHVPAQPVLGRQAEMEREATGGSVNVRVAGAASYILKREDARLVDVSALPKRPEALVSVLVLRGGAIEARTYGDGNYTGPANAVLDSYGPEQWTASAVVPPAATDLLGMSLGIPLASFQEQVAQRLPSGQDYVTKIPGEGLFGHAHFRHDPATGEAIGAVYAAHAEGDPVVALMRWLELPLAEGATPEALEATLVQKYGPVQGKRGDGYWVWGALPSDLDHRGFCGGDSTFNRRSEQVPTLAPAEGESRGEPGWTQLGWPQTVKEGGGPWLIPDAADCGPVVTAWATKSGDRLVAQIWLMDRKLAGDLAAAAPPPPAKLNIEF